MQKSELKNLVFDRFEKRRMEIIKKRNRFQQELDQDLHQLREAYGDVAVSDLGDLSLTVTQPEAASAKDRRMPTEPPREQSRSRPKRKRQRRPAGAPMVRNLLEEHVPAAIAAVAARSEEFQARDIHDHLTNVSKIDIRYGNVSLYLRRYARKLGLTVEKRNEGEPIPRPTNFFRKGRAKATKKIRRAKPAGHVDWEGNITGALKGLRKGRTIEGLKERLIERGVPKVKFRGHGFGNALRKLVDEGTIKRKNDLYRT